MTIHELQNEILRLKKKMMSVFLLIPIRRMRYKKLQIILGMY